MKKRLSKVRSAEGPPMGKAMQLRFRLLRAHVIFSILTALLVAGVTFFYLQGKLVDNSKMKLILALESRELLIEKVLESGRSAVQVLCGRTNLCRCACEMLNGTQSGEAGRAELESLLWDSLNSDRDILYAAVLSADGRILAEAGTRSEREPGPLLPESASEILVGIPLFEGPTPRLSFSALLICPPNQPRPGLMVTFQVPALLEAVYGSTNLGRTCETLLGTSRGEELLLFSPPRLRLEEREEDEKADWDGARPLAMAVAGESRLISTRDYRGADVLAAFQPIAGTDWGLVVKMDRDEIREPVIRAALLILATTAVLVTLSLVLALKKLGPIADFLVLWNRELEDKVKTRTRELRDSEETYRLLTESFTDGALIVQDGRIMYANPAFTGLLGVPDKAYQGAPLSEWLAGGQAPLLKHRDQMREQGMNPEPRFNLKLVDQRGKTVPVEVVEKRITYRDHDAFHLSVRDLGAIKRLHMYESVLPTCCVCKAIRDDSDTERGKGAWVPLEIYLKRHADTRMSHTYCPLCEDEVLRTHKLSRS